MMFLHYATFFNETGRGNSCHRDYSENGFEWASITKNLNDINSNGNTLSSLYSIGYGEYCKTRLGNHYCSKVTGHFCGSRLARR